MTTMFGFHNKLTSKLRTDSRARIARTISIVYT